MDVLFSGRIESRAKTSYIILVGNTSAWNTSQSIVDLLGGLQGSRHFYWRLFVDR